MLELESAAKHINLTPDELIELSVKHHEAVLSNNGALRVTTGKRTGRSPKDRFIVEDSVTEKTVDWGDINQPIAIDAANNLWKKAVDYISNKESFTSYLRVGADEKYYLPIKVVTETAWHQLFANTLFIRRSTPYIQDEHQWTVLNTPGLKIDPNIDGTNSDGVVILDFDRRRVLIVGIRYAGEIKKAMFSVLNFLLPKYKVLPMHCAANVGNNGDVALFFGLSGTGKTTLSADPERYLMGDDEHGWSENGVFNFEGGCYAKCIDLSREREPVIWNAIRHGAIMENVALNNNGDPDYGDDSLTQNTRAVYPREHIPRRVNENRAGHPDAILFLTCDMYGVLPPVALLTQEQAAYYFLSGYTALVGSTEIAAGSDIKPTFSTCFGAPFFSRPAKVYADLLLQRITETGAQVYLVNTGWTGGSKGEGGERLSIPVTRQIVVACLSGEFIHAPNQTLAGFNIKIPMALKNGDAKLLNPKKTWARQSDYNTKAQSLIEQFQENFKQFDVAENICNAGPTDL